MVNKIGTVYSYGSNKGFSSKFCMDAWFQHETPEVGQRTYRPKRYYYSNKDYIISPNIFCNNKYVSVSSSKEQHNWKKDLNM